jgi:hypothetical protein
VSYHFQEASDVREINEFYEGNNLEQKSMTRKAYALFTTSLSVRLAQQHPFEAGHVREKIIARITGKERTLPCGVSVYFFLPIRYSYILINDAPLPLFFPTYSCH